MSESILGISAYYHDSAAALLKDGEVIAAAHEERFTRKKQDSDFPLNAAKYVLEEAGLQLDQLDAIAFYDKPYLKFERLLETYHGFSPKGLKSFLSAMPVWIKEKLFMRKMLHDELAKIGDGKVRILFPEHHLSHAASAFYPSPFEDAAILTIDGVGEWATTTIGRGNNNQIEILRELDFPHSLGLLYSAFTYYLGFKVNSGEYKVMGLAPYGEPKYTKLILDNLVDLKEDGSFKLNMKYFGYLDSLRMTNGRFARLFGEPARKPETQLTQREMDIASSLQYVTEEIMLKMAAHAYKTTGMKNLCLAGGVALNCVGNGRLLREGPFENIWIQPAAGDAGGALGAALFGWYRYLGNERKSDGRSDKMNGSYLGPSYSDDEIQIFLDEKEIPHKKLCSESLARETARLLSEVKTVGWFQGRMEFGPRALGGRSIIGDARSKEMQSVMNLKIKFRESFRPFAPAVLRDEIDKWFEMESDSPYMLLVAPVKEDKRLSLTADEEKLFGIDLLNIPKSEIPAVTHVDYSARIQTVDGTTNKPYYDTIKEFNEITGCPVIVNTSFNVRGEPIVCTPEDAYRCFMRTNMDNLVMENFILDKKEQPELKDDVDWQKEYELD